ncbi:hypothetical protein CYMTET_21186, partial [Cymbomonas tetramitiformis]
RRRQGSQVKPSEMAVRYSPIELLEVAEKVVARHFPGKIAPIVPASIALVESAGDPKAYRWEAHINEGSTGLCQTLLSTAVWLATDMGYNTYGKPTDATLEDPEISFYFGAAYLIWLSTYKRIQQTEEFIVRGFNGGPNGINASVTVRYWEKYNAAKKAITTLKTATGDGTIPSDLQYHIVEPGDYLGKIAGKYGVSVDILKAMNPELDPNTINIGQIIWIKGTIPDAPAQNIPAGDCVIHKVKPGEFLGRIAANYGVSTDQILDINPMLRQNPDQLSVGQSIKIPGTGAGAGTSHSDAGPLKKFLKFAVKSLRVDKVITKVLGANKEIVMMVANFLLGTLTKQLKGPKS